MEMLRVSTWSFYRADWRRIKKIEREGRGRGSGEVGENEEIDMEKEEKITNVIWPAAAVIISHSS